MYNTPAATAPIAVTPSRVPASRIRASVEGLMGVGTAMSARGTHSPAFLKDVFSGVRAWSPPV
jgi:hypothetical protein